MGAQPGTEGAPDALREGDGEVLKQSLTDEPCLDEDVVGVKLALYVVAVFERRAMKMLIAVRPATNFVKMLFWSALEEKFGQPLT